MESDLRPTIPSLSTRFVLLGVESWDTVAADDDANEYQHDSVEAANFVWWVELVSYDYERQI